MLTACGARPTQEGTHFAVWAPKAERVEVVIYQHEDTCEQHSTVHTLSKSADGIFRTLVAEAREGSLYKYRVDGKGPFPDPVSRFQPKGVHGPSQVMDFTRFEWTDANWRGLPSMDKLVVYEIHVGTFSDKGNYAGVMEKLRYFKELGVTAIQLMPLADFPGSRNWGYDGVCLYAPARCYGTPEELRQLVNSAHELGVAVFIDCVYNHLGPDGNYLSCFSPFYFTDKTKTPWGTAVNVDPGLDAEHAPHVRRFLMESALCWLRDYHFDGIRLDATHAIVDTSTPHFLAELSRACHEAGPPGKSVYVVAEDDRNESSLITSTGFDGLWADDAHHQIRVHLTGEQDGYYSDFTGSIADLAATLRQGWFFAGQAKKSGEKRGADPTSVAQLSRFTICIQNHDQIGNRALGDRLNHAVSLARYRAASVLLLLAPQSPLLFQGQEWGASTPFAFFTDHTAELGKLVTEGRRKEFAHFAAFADPAQRERIPDPQAQSTFDGSKLKWPETVLAPHADLLRLYSALLRVRATHPACQSSHRSLFDCVPVGPHTLCLVRRAPPSLSEPAVTLLVLVHLDEHGARIALSDVHSSLLPAQQHHQQQHRAVQSVVYRTDNAELEADGSAVSFRGAGAILLDL